MPDIIKPQTLKGFRDLLPDAALARERMMEQARGVYRRYGFAPIDTPALEYAEILLGKGGAESDKQLFRFTDAGGRDVALRFDLTVPFARFAAQHLGRLGTPFKRYHLGTVWRGEKPQKGRYREFVQCDFDTIGTTSVLADAETVLVIHDLLTTLGFSAFTVRLNHRGVLSGFLDTLGLADHATDVLRALDKLPKLGGAKVRAELGGVPGADAAKIDRLLEFAALSGEAGPTLDAAAPLLDGHDAGTAALGRLREVVTLCEAAGVPGDRLRADLAIARGLDYYTGVVFETFLDDLPGIGSVCSGGRYDDLAGLYTKQPLPGVGASLGLDRLLAAMDELGTAPSATPADVFVARFSPDRAADDFALAAELRSAGLTVTLYPEPKNLGKQLKWAVSRGFRAAVFVGDDEFAAGTVAVKDLSSGEQRAVHREEVGGVLRAA